MIHNLYLPRTAGDQKLKDFLVFHGSFRDTGLFAAGRLNETEG